MRGHENEGKGFNCYLSGPFLTGDCFNVTFRAKGKLSLALALSLTGKMESNLSDRCFDTSFVYLPFEKSKLQSSSTNCTTLTINIIA